MSAEPEKLKVRAVHRGRHWRGNITNIQVWTLLR